MTEYAATSRIDLLTAVVREHAPAGPLRACRSCGLVSCPTRLDALGELRTLGVPGLPRREVATP